MTKAEILEKLQTARGVIITLKANAVTDQTTIANLTNTVSELQSPQAETEVDADIANAVNDLESAT